MSEDNVYVEETLIFTYDIKNKEQCNSPKKT